MSQETHPRSGIHICSRGRPRMRAKSPLGDSFDNMGGGGSSAVDLMGRRYEKKYQANFESRNTNSGEWINNGHLDVNM